MRTVSNLLLLTLAAGCALCHPARAQFQSAVQSAREGALGGCVIVSPFDRFAEATYVHGYAPTGVDDKRLRLQLSLSGRGIVGAAYGHFGNATFHEQQFSATYALRLSEWLFAGVEGWWLHRGSDDVHYPSHQWLAASVYALAGWRSTTVSVWAGSRPWDRQRPYRAVFQLGYRPSMPLLTLVQLESEECWRWRMGVEYCYDRWLFLRAGFFTRPLTMTFGGGVRRSRYGVDLAFEVHNALGISPQLSVSLWF